MQPPPPTHTRTAADTPESPRSCADRVGIGTPHGGEWQVCAVPPLQRSGGYTQVPAGHGVPGGG